MSFTYISGYPKIWWSKFFLYVRTLGNKFFISKMETFVIYYIVSHSKESVNVSFCDYSFEEYNFSLQRWYIKNTHAIENNIIKIYFPNYTMFYFN